MGTWTNSDGLYIKYGQDKATATKAGEYSTLGLEHVAEAFFTLTAIGTGATLLADNVVIPNGARISKVVVIADVAATSGGAAVLNIGLVDQDRSTAIDIDGLVAALPLANINVIGETNSFTAGVTYAGALVGTTLTNAGLLVADYDTAAFTAGVVRVNVYYYFPTV